jgi:hypothetical protein
MLKGNRSLLNSFLIGRDEVQMPKEVILSQGFNPNFHTHRSVSEDNQLVLGIYEFWVYWTDKQVVVSRKSLAEQPLISFQGQTG